MKKDCFTWIHQHLEEICDSISSTDFSEEDKTAMIECMIEIIAYFENIAAVDESN